jgi:hypothetical protein
MRCEVKTLGAFLQRIAVYGFRCGYKRYAVRHIPEGKDLVVIDRKLIDTYGVTRCRMQRLRERQRGNASVQYVRWGHSFILMATDGAHPTFSKVRSFDARVSPLHFGGYSIGFSGDAVSVRVAQDVWQPMCARLITSALRDKQIVEQQFLTLPYCRFPGVVAQLRSAETAINQKRQRAGLKLIEVVGLRPEFKGWPHGTRKKGVQLTYVQITE